MIAGVDSNKVLPCNNDPEAVKQVQPAIDLLKNLDKQHPEILNKHGLIPRDYHPKLVFRSAVESIRGTYIASSVTKRQDMIATTLEAMRQKGLIVDYKRTAGKQRYDFEVVSRTKPKIMCAIEVKGGEGNSINISERPIWADEFILWCHLDGAIVNQPYHGAEAIIFNRVATEMVKRKKHVDAIVFRDVTCNTALRVCPKYAGKEPPTELGVAPDIFLLPKDVPTEQNPNPPPHDLKTTQLPAKILVAYGVKPKDFDNHLWQVSIALEHNDKRTVRVTSVFHKGKLILERRSSR